MSEHYMFSFIRGKIVPHLTFSTGLHSRNKQGYKNPLKAENPYSGIGWFRMITFDVFLKFLCNPTLKYFKSYFPLRTSMEVKDIVSEDLGPQSLWLMCVLVLSITFSASPPILYMMYSSKQPPVLSS